MSSARAILLAVILAAGIVVLINFTPHCKPGDPGIHIGSVMLVDGCPR